MSRCYFSNWCLAPPPVAASLGGPFRTQVFSSLTITHLSHPLTSCLVSLMQRELHCGRHRYGVDIYHYLSIDNQALPREVSLGIDKEALLQHRANLLQPTREAVYTKEGSSFRWTLATMFSNAGSVRSMLDRKAKGRKRSSASTEEVINAFPTTPSGHRSGPETSNYTATADSTPLSTFDRPTTPVPHWPLPALRTANARPMTSATNRNKEVRPSASRASLSGRDAQPRSPRLTYSYPTVPGRFPATPALPPSWSVVHDRAICVLDACDYSLNATVKKLRSAFPELAGSVLTAVMVDKRLRTLDQNPSIDFFRIGLEHLLLTRDDEEGVSPVSRAKLVERAARVDHGDATPSMPSFSSVSTGRQNSMNESLPFKASLDVDRSPTSSNSSKVPKATKSVVRSYPFGTGYLSYRTTADEDEPRDLENMEPVRSA